MSECPLREPHSLILPLAASGLSDSDKSKILWNETRWHYSQHYLAECRGEEVIEDLLIWAQNKRQRALLGAQLKDEKEHAKLFRTIIDRIGLDERATAYANGYANLAKEQKSLAEKVYVFQIVTEAASAAYCEWRLAAIEEPSFMQVDHVVQADELRHLLMGKSMMMICDPDEISESLTANRRIELIRAMNEICQSITKTQMPNAIIPNGRRENSIKGTSSRLDRVVARSVLREARNIETALRKEAI